MNRSGPLLLDRVDLFLEFLVLLKGNGHNWALRHDFSQLDIEVTSNALGELDSALQVVRVLFVVVKSAHSAND